MQHGGYVSVQSSIGYQSVNIKKNSPVYQTPSNIFQGKSTKSIIIAQFVNSQFIHERDDCLLATGQEDLL